MKRLLYLLLFFASVANAQTPIGIYNSSNVHDITWQDTDPDHVWRDGTTYTTYLYAPYFYQITTWKIVDVWDSTIVIASGTGQKVQYTASWAGNDKNNTYFLIANSSPLGGSLPAKRRLFHLTVMRAKFLEGQADLVIDLAAGGCGDYNGNGTDRGATGYQIYVKHAGTGTCHLDFFYWVSSNPLKPVHIEFDDATIIADNNSRKGLEWGESQNLIFDGLYNSGRYGIRVKNNTAGGSITEKCYFTMGDAARSSKNIITCGIFVDGFGPTFGGDGFVLHSVNNGTFNDNTYQMSRLTVFKCKVINTANEGFYIGQTEYHNENPPFSRYTDALFYDLNADNTSNEGFQIGGAIRTMVFDNSFTNTGQTNTNGQENIIAVKGGDSNLFMMWNSGYTHYDMIQLFNDIIGDDIEFFANQLESDVAGHVGYLFDYYQTTAVAPVYHGMYNNLLKFPTGIIIALYNDAVFTPTTQPALKFYSNRNVLIQSSATAYTANNGYTTSSTIMNNKIYNAGTSGALFTDEAHHDFRPSSLSSDLFGATDNSTCAAARKCIWQNFGIDHYQFPTTNIAYGPNTGTPLMTH